MRACHACNPGSNPGQGERAYKRFDSFHHQIYKGGKAQGILKNMLSYFNKVAEQVKAADHRVEKLPEPNRQYAKDLEIFQQIQHFVNVHTLHHSTLILFLISAVYKRDGHKYSACTGTF